MDSIFYAGLRIIQTPMAIDVKTSFEIRRHPIQKRRRRWHVVKVETRTPACWKAANGMVYMHPDVYKQLLHAVATQPPQQGEQS